MGWVGAKPHGRVDCLDAADTLVERVDGFIDHRRRIRLTMKAGKSSRPQRSLSSEVTNWPGVLEGFVLGRDFPSPVPQASSWEPDS